MTENLHPLFAEILRPHLAVTSTVQDLELYHATIGMRRGFRSPADAKAYEAGYASYRDFEPAPVGPKTPYVQGWSDAFAASESAAMESIEFRLDDDDDEVMA